MTAKLLRTERESFVRGASPADRHGARAPASPVSGDLTLLDAAGNIILLGSALPYDAASVRGLAERAGIEFDIYVALWMSRAGLHALFWNPDGTADTFCGNACRSIGYLFRERRLQTPAGLVHVGGDTDCGWLELSVGNIEAMALPHVPNAYFINPGTPHLVWFVADQAELAPELERLAQTLNASLTMVHGTDATGLLVETDERGAGKTGSCGSGALAAVLCARRHGLIGARKACAVQFPHQRTLHVDTHGDTARISGPVHVLDAPGLQDTDLATDPRLRQPGGVDVEFV